LITPAFQLSKQTNATQRNCLQSGGNPSSLILPGCMGHLVERSTQKAQWQCTDEQQELHLKSKYL